MDTEISVVLHQWNLLEIRPLKVARNVPCRVLGKAVSRKVSHQRCSTTKLSGWRELDTLLEPSAGEATLTAESLHWKNRVLCQNLLGLTHQDQEAKSFSCTISSTHSIKKASVSTGLRKKILNGTTEQSSRVTLELSDNKSITRERNKKKFYN